MSYFKRFTDFCAGFIAFHSIIYFIGQFMSYNPAGDLSMTEKLKLLLAEDHPKAHRELLVLIALLVASVIIGRIFEKLPYVSMAFSLLPMIKIILMFCDGKLFDRPMLYVILGLLHVSGNVLHALSLDRADGKRRAVICVHTFGVAAFILGVWLKNRAAELTALDDETQAELGEIDMDILAGVEKGAEDIIFKLAIFILVSVIVSILLRDLYFIDAIAAAVPFGWTVYALNAEKLTVFPAVVLTTTFLYFAFRVLLLVAEPMAKKFTLLRKRKSSDIKA